MESIANELKLSKRTIKIFKSSQLTELIIIKPNEQRIVDNQKVSDIVNYQLEQIKKNGQSNFLGVINIHYYRKNDTSYLVDGQHRYEALKILLQKYSHDIEIFIEIVNVDSLQELKENYDLINKNTPLPEFPESVDKNIPEKCSQYFQEKYPTVWSPSSRARRPNVYFNFFQESIAILVEKLKIKTADEIKEIVEKHNTTLSIWDISSFHNITEKMFIKATESKFYLGLFLHCTNDYGYKWVEDIITQYTGEKIQKMNRNSKKKIPKKVKNDSWDKYIGSSIGETSCIVCRHTKINSKCFDAGHIISEKNGGVINIDNILPICSGCNKSMGTTNMDEYIQINYPNNYNNFIKRNYNQ
jgi:hypothetical protein